jgi:hypothetical protein
MVSLWSSGNNLPTLRAALLRQLWCGVTHPSVAGSWRPHLFVHRAHSFITECAHVHEGKGDCDADGDDEGDHSISLLSRLSRNAISSIISILPSRRQHFMGRMRFLSVTGWDAIHLLHARNFRLVLNAVGHARPTCARL